MNLTISGVKDNYTINLNNVIYHRKLDKEQFNNLMNCYNQNDEEGVLNIIKKHSIQDIINKDDNYYFKGCDLALKGFLQEHILEAIKNNDFIKLEKLKKFHFKCAENKIDNINSLYDHLIQNFFNLNSEGDIIVYKKAKMIVDKDFSKFKGFYLKDGIVNCLFKEVTEQEAKEFIELCNSDKIYASYSVDNDLKEKFYLVDENNNKTEHLGYVEYKLNLTTFIDNYESNNIECGKKLHSTCQKNYASKFSGNILLIGTINPKWIVNVPPSDTDWKLGSYGLKIIGVIADDVELDNL